MPQAFAGANQVGAQVGQVGAADVAELDAFEVGPDAFVRIEIGRVARQPLQLQALGRSSLQEVLDRLALVDR